MTRILLAVDGSEHDISSTEWLGRLLAAFAPGVEIIVLTVAHLRLPGPSSIGLGIVPRFPSSEALQGIEEQTRTEAHEIVESVGADLTEYGFAVTTLVEWGPTADVILEVAASRACDLIAIGRHGAGKVSDLIVGSVSDRVMRRARVPVLVLHSPLDN